MSDRKHKVRIGIDIGERTTSLAAIDASDETLCRHHTIGILHWAQYDARTCRTWNGGPVSRQPERTRSADDGAADAVSNEALTRNLLWLLSDDVNLKKLINDADSVQVTIEQQLPNAMTNRILSHVVQAWFVMRSFEEWSGDRIEVEFQHGSKSATVMVMCNDPPCEYAETLARKLDSTNDYRRKKATTVRDARRLLTCAPQSESWLLFFDTFRQEGDQGENEKQEEESFVNKKKKKCANRTRLPDNADLADALLHALSGELTCRNLPLVWPIDVSSDTTKVPVPKKRKKPSAKRSTKKVPAKGTAAQAYFASLDQK